MTGRQDGFDEIFDANILVRESCKAKNFIGDGSQLTGIPSPDLSAYFKLDQTTQQTISNGKPYFADGAIVNLYDTSSVLSVDANGRILYANDGSSKAIEYPSTTAINFYLENANNFIMELYGGQYNFRPATTDHDNLGTSDYYWLNAYLRTINGESIYLENSADDTKYMDLKTDGTSTITDATSTTTFNTDLHAVGSSRSDSDTHGSLATTFAGGEFGANFAGGTYSGAIGVAGYAGYFNDPTGNIAYICDGTYAVNTANGINAGNYYAGGVQGYTGDLNDSTSTKIADVVGGIITAVYY